MEETKGNKLFGDGNIPKNKDMNGFTKDVQKTSLLQTYLKKRFKRSASKEGQTTFMDLPHSHSFGRHD